MQRSTILDLVQINVGEKRKIACYYTYKWINKMSFFIQQALVSSVYTLLCKVLWETPKIKGKILVINSLYFGMTELEIYLC